MRSFIVLSLIVAFATVQVHAWGNDGHYIVGALASYQLDEHILDKCNELLYNKTLADVASWADQIRDDPQWQWVPPLHFINTPDWACNFEYYRDCKHDVCIAGAITNFTSQLVKNYGVGAEDALKFVVHFIGDIHQPLHVSFASNFGGNTIHVTFDGKDTNLHSVWDSGILKKRIEDDFHGNRDNYIQYLLHNTTSADSTPVDINIWGNDSALMACRYAYKNSYGHHIRYGDYLDYHYYEFTKHVIDRQLRRGGAMLAAWLKYINFADFSTTSVVGK